MRCVRLFALVSAIALGTSVLATAQEHGKAGITIGYPGDIGVLWHVSDAVALRPELSFTHSSGDTASGGSSSGWSSGVGVSALFYVKKYDSVRTYVSPQFTYTHATVSATPTSSTQTSLPSVTSSNNSTGGNGSFGVQYTPGAHFAVYGEFGIGFSHQKSSYSGTGGGTGSTATSWGSVAGVGVVFYP